MGNGDRIAITGIGLVCSVGLDAPSSLAAIRCDITNFSGHETGRARDKRIEWNLASFLHDGEVVE